MGGAIQGSELAEFLVKRGREVILTDPAAELGEGLPPGKKEWLFEWLQEKKAVMLTEVTYKKISDSGLELFTKSGERLALQTDSIVTASPMSPNTDLIQMMENTGRNLANLTRKRYPRKDQSGKSVVMMAGPGGNGGGALVCARHLNNIGIKVIVVTSRPGPDFSQVPAQQLEIIQ